MPTSLSETSLIKSRLTGNLKSVWSVRFFAMFGWILASEIGLLCCAKKSRKKRKHFSGGWKAKKRNLMLIRASQVSTSELTRIPSHSSFSFTSQSARPNIRHTKQKDYSQLMNTWVLNRLQSNRRRSFLKDLCFRSSANQMIVVVTDDYCCVRLNGDSNYWHQETCALLSN